MNKEALDKKIFILLTSKQQEDINKGFKLLYHNYARELERFLIKKKVVMRNADYGDLVQASIIIFWDNLQNQKVEQMPGKLFNYLQRIANNIFLSTLRKQLREQEQVNTLSTVNEQDASTYEVLGLIEGLNDLRKKNLRVCLRELRETNREIIMKYYFEGQTGEELAEAYGKDLNWINQRLFQTRKRLKKCILSKNNSKH